jgi:multiple sugar transport system substrate-binding protein
MEFNRWIPYITAQGGSEPWFASADDASWFDETAVKGAFEDIFDWYATGRKAKLDASETPWLGEASDAAGSGWRGDAFGSGEAGMVISGNWMIPFMNGTYPNFKYGTDWGIAAMPEGSVGRSTMAFTVALGINAHTAYPQETWDFVEYLLGTAGQTKLVVQEGQTLPSIKGLDTHADMWPEHAATLGHTYDTITVHAYGPEGSTLHGDFSTIMAAVMRGEVTAAQALIDMKAAVAEAFA